MKYSIFAFFIVLFSGCASLAQDGAVIRAYNNYEKGECTDVIEIVDRAVRVYDYADERKAELLFLKAGCLEQANDIDGAIALHGYIAYTYPKTQFGFRSKAILNKVRNIQAERAGKLGNDI